MVEAIVILLFAGVFAIDYLPIIKSGNKRTRMLYGFLFAASFALLMLPSLGIKIPSLIKPIMTVLQYIVG